MTMIFITPPPETPRREIVKDGIRYREVRAGDDASGSEILIIIVVMLFVVLPLLFAFARWFIIPMMTFISTGHWSWEL